MADTGLAKKVGGTFRAATRVVDLHEVAVRRTPLTFGALVIHDYRKFSIIIRSDSARSIWDQAI
jgi:hypothetical protein